MMKSMWEIFVPTISNEGVPFRTRHHKEWDNKVKRITGGLTIFKPVKGKWIVMTSPENKLYEDRMIPVRIACNENEIRKIMEITKKHYNQIDVLAYEISNRVLFLSELKSEETDEVYSEREWFEKATTAEIKSINEEIESIYKELDELRKSWRDQQNQMNKFVDPGTFKVGASEKKLIDKEMETLKNPFDGSVIFGGGGRLFTNND